MYQGHSTHHCTYPVSWVTQSLQVVVILHFILTLCSLWFLPFSVFVLCPISQPSSKPFLTVIPSHTCQGLAPLCQELLPGSSAGSRPWSIPLPLPILQQQQQQWWLAAPPTSPNGFPTTTSRFSHPHRISLSAPKLHSEDDSSGQCHSRAQQPTELYLFVAPLHADQCQQSCLINISHHSTRSISSSPHSLNHFYS